MKQRDDARFAQSMHLTQLANIQVELCETRARADMLRDQLSAETRRADRAEAQLDILKTLRGGGSFLSYGERYHDEGPAGGYRDSHGGMDDYWPNSRQRYGPYGQRSTLLSGTESSAERHPVRRHENVAPFDSPANPMSLTSEFEGGSSSPLMATSSSSMQPSQFTVTISPRKPLTMEGPSVENSRVTEILADETALIPLGQPA
jgi:hypothetical protein